MLAACPIPIPAPAEIDALEEVAFKLKLVAAGTVGPAIVIVLALLLRVMFAPATSETLAVDAFRLKAAPPAAPINEITPGAVLMVMFEPEKAIVPVDVARPLA